MRSLFEVLFVLSIATMLGALSTAIVLGLAGMGRAIVGAARPTARLTPANLAPDQRSGARAA